MLINIWESLNLDLYSVFVLTFFNDIQTLLYENKALWNTITDSSQKNFLPIFSFRNNKKVKYENL